MTWRGRIAVTLFVGTVSVGIVLGLTLLGSASQGPLTTLLGFLGSGVSRMESRAARSLRGGSRALELEWLAPYRNNPDSLGRPHRLLLGAHVEGMPASLQGVVELEDALQTTLPLLQTYSAWGDGLSFRFPTRVLEAMRELGSVPVVTWEPWLTTFENRLHPELPLRDNRDRNGLSAVARGEYDFYLSEWAREAADFGTPLIVRLAHEMNDPYRYPWGPQNNEPQEFIAAWRHVVDVVREAGGDNVLWAWSPHLAYPGYERYWPGDDYVDWVATSSLNYGSVAYWSQWWSFQEIFAQHYDFLAGFGRPLMIAEFGSLAVGGDRVAWYEDALRDFPQRFPAVKALLFFHKGGDDTVTLQSLDWTFARDPEVVVAIRQAIEGWQAQAGTGPPGGPGAR